MEWDSDTSVKPGETAFQWARRTGNYSTIRICSCCMIIEANGDACGTEDCDTCAPGGLYERAYAERPNMTATLGAFTGEGGCAHDLGNEGESEDHVLECERFGFSWSPCDLCGGHLGGDRYAATLFPRDIPTPFVPATKDNRWTSNLFTYTKQETGK